MHRADELYLRMLLDMHVASEGCRRVNKPDPWKLAENPEDPETYVKEDSLMWKAARDNGGFPSFFATQEFRTSASILGLEVYSGDQGPYGHTKRKPTSWASNRPLPALLRGPGTGLEVEGVDETGWPSAKWAKWAPGMIQLLGNMLNHEERSGERVAKVDIDWESHVRNGHWPPSRRCRVCIGATARQRAHRRVDSPASWTLAMDTIGPFKKAEDETSGSLRYVLVACLLVPVDGKGKPVMGTEQQQADEPEGRDEPKHDRAEAEEINGSGVQRDQADRETKPAEESDLLPDWDALWDEDDPGENDPGAVEVDAKALEACGKDAEGLSAEEKACSVTGLKWREVIFTEPMRRKSPAAVEQAAVKIITEIQELGFPILRIHSDHGVEFVNPLMRKLVTRFGIRQTCSAPEEHNSNGRIENVVRRLKGQVRTYLYDQGSEVKLWPLAARAASATWRSQVLRQMGLAVPAVVPYGTRVQVLARTWLRRYKEQSWTLRAVPATVLCPASLVKMGYVVRVNKRLSVVTRLFEGEQPPMRMSLETPDTGPPVSHSIGPEARISRKTTIPDMSRIPAPSRRFRYKAPGPGRVPILSRLQANHEEEKEEDEQAVATATKEPFDLEEAKQFLLQSSCVQYVPTPNTPGHQGPQLGVHYLFGACARAGRMEVSQHCKIRPGMCALITTIAKHMCPDVRFTTALLGVNTATYPKGPPNMDTGSVWLPIVMPATGARLWTELAEGSLVTGTPAVMQIGKQTHVGQYHKSDCPVHLPTNKLVTTETWSSTDLRVSILLWQHHGHEKLASEVRNDLAELGFALATEQSEGGDTHANTQVDSLGQQSHSDGVPRVVGPGENQTADDSKKSHSNGVPRVVGSGETAKPQAKRVEHFCRVCESPELVNQGGQCSGCGLQVRTIREFSVLNAEVQFCAPFTNIKNPKNGILQDPKNCIPKNPKNCKTHIKSVTETELQECQSVSDDGDARISYAWACCETQVGTERVQMRVSVDVEKTAGDEAEGEGSPPDDAERPRWLGCVGVVGSDLLDDGAVPEESGSNEADEKLAKDETPGGRNPLEEYEHVMCDSTEHLKPVGDSRWTGNAKQRDIEQFASWLDDCQVRLSQAHRDELQAWIDEEVPGSDEARERQRQLDQLWRNVEDLRLELKSLCMEQVVSDAHDIAGASGLATTEGRETVLQTRIVANAQVMAEWELWSPSTEIEVNGLINDKQALERSTQTELNHLQAQGVKITLIPSKVIHSLKAPCGRRKCRLVACGNYLAASEDSKQAHKQVVYTASIGIEALRTGLAYSARRGHTILTIDIKAAFLNAQLLPRDRVEAEGVVASELQGSSGVAKDSRAEESQEQRQPVLPTASKREVVALIPPRMLITKGVFSHQTRLVVKKAVYGLDQAPRDLAFLRDARLPKLVIECHGHEYKLYQSFSEENMWLVASREPKRGFEASESEGSDYEIEGWAAVYVDDILIAAEDALAWAVSKAIADCWECSRPEKVSGDPEHPVRFLGIDFFWDTDNNLVLSQEAYLRDLEKRSASELACFGKPLSPMSSTFNEDTSEEGPDIADVRRAQTLVGELLWAAIRTRPDVSYSVSKLASVLTKAPIATYKAGLHVLAYLVASTDVKLTYWKDSRSVWSEYKRNPDPQYMVEGYGDASFAPEARRSMQCRGMPYSMVGLEAVIYGSVFV